MVSLTKDEQKKLKVFFEQNMEWIKNNSLLDEDNINIFIDMYEDYLNDNHLTYSRALMMLIVEMKQEATKARFNDKPIRIQNLSISRVPLSAKISNNQTINTWMSASNIVIADENNKYLNEIDYMELDRIIMERREKMEIEKLQKSKKQKNKQKTK